MALATALLLVVRGGRLRLRARHARSSRAKRNGGRARALRVRVADCRPSRLGDSPWLVLAHARSGAHGWLARLPAWLASPLGLFLRNLAVALRPSHSLRGLIEVAASFTTPLSGALLPAPHRHGHEEHHKHEGDRDHDHNDAGAHREHSDEALLIPVSFPQALFAGPRYRRR